MIISRGLVIGFSLTAVVPARLPRESFLRNSVVRLKNTSLFSGGSATLLYRELSCCWKRAGQEVRRKYRESISIASANEVSIFINSERTILDAVPDLSLATKLRPGDERLPGRFISRRGRGFDKIAIPPPPHPPLFGLFAVEIEKSP